MQLDLASLWKSARGATAAWPAADAPGSAGERLVMAVATTLGVLVVVLIAVLMGLVN